MVDLSGCPEFPGARGAGWKSGGRCSGGEFQVFYGFSMGLIWFYCSFIWFSMVLCGFMLFYYGSTKVL